MIDSHTHLNHEDFAADLAEVLARAAAAGVEQMLVPGYDLPSSQAAVALAQQYPQLVASVGVHPHDAKSLTEADLAELKELAAHPKVVAIGEIGLDFHYNFSPPEQQAEAFARQIRLAHEVELPIIIHQREAAEQARQIFLTEGAGARGGVWHCFTGDAELAHFAVEQGYCIGIAGPVTFTKAQDLAALAAQLPLENLLIETDAPYLSPTPFRGKRNEPARVVPIAGKLAELRGDPVEIIESATTTNFGRVFLRQLPG